MKNMSENIGMIAMTLCQLLLLLFMTPVILGGVRGTKNRTVHIVFQSEYYVKISSTGNEV